MSEQVRRIQKALEEGSITEQQIDILMELHELKSYEQLLNLLQDHLVGIITRRDENAFELLSNDPARHQIHDILTVLTKLAVSTP